MITDKLLLTDNFTCGLKWAVGAGGDEILPHEEIAGMRMGVKITCHTVNSQSGFHGWFLVAACSKRWAVCWKSYAESLLAQVR